MFILRYDHQGQHKTHRLTANRTLAGRLPTSDLTLDDPSVSRVHASFRIGEGRCFLQDAGSRYGTFRNGERIVDEVELAVGDTLQLGEVTMTVEQLVEESALLSENHHVDDGPDTVFRPIIDRAIPAVSGQDHVIRLLAETVKMLGTSQSLADTLNRVVDLAFLAVRADRAFLMLRESADEALVAKVLRQRDGAVPEHATLSRNVVRRVMRDRVAMLAMDATTDPAVGITDSIVALNIRSFMCAPLLRDDEVIGVLYVDSPRSARFAPADLDVFTALANAAAVAIEQSRLSGQLREELRRRERLQRYHSPSVVSRILHGGSDDASTVARERDLTVLFCDIVGFTGLCEKLPPAETSALLNGFLTCMTDVVFRHDGTLDKFIGDALLAVFGAPFDDPDHPQKAVDAALAMRDALAEFNAHREGPPIVMRVAINTGTALTGDIGSPKRREFTVLGDVVNTAARMEGEVAAPGEIVIADSTYQRVKASVRARSVGLKKLRGRVASLEVYVVEDRRIS